MVVQRRAVALGAHRLPVTVPAQDETTDRVDRMARFAAGARRLVVRAVTIGALVAAGWLFALVFGMITAAPAAAEVATPTADAQVKSTAAQPVDGDVSAQVSRSLISPDGATASDNDNAEAMAGRTVDGLNSQQDPGLPTPSTAGKILDTNGLVPNGGGSGSFGAAAGDVARSVFDPRLQVLRALVARVPAPVVRTAADDPSFSPD
ncbi:hypothetical protein ACIBQ1_26000 [Nonomuraea sp. NPDC050153]|uniref:hypothetical protein n=1 Tax=Nonomuraea sp. NPDC050153 TaxID=3364359 RepID=UPI00378799C3